MDSPETLALPLNRRVLMPYALKLFLKLSAALYLASSAYLVMVVLTNNSPHHGLPLDIYSRLLFYDLVGYVIKMSQMHQAVFFSGLWPYVYPAPCIFIFQLFSFFAHLPIRHPFFGSIVAYLVLTLLGLLYLCRRFIASLKWQGMYNKQARFFAYGTLLLSWPILFSIHQGNIETLLWMGVAAAIWLYYKKRWMAFAVMIGIFGSFKLYPLVFLLLLLSRKMWKPVVLSLLAFITMTFGSLVYIGPTLPVALQRVSAGVQMFNRTGLMPAGVADSSKPFDHSLNGLLHRTLSASPEALALLFHWYMPVVAFLFLSVYLFRIRKFPTMNQVLFLTLGAVTLPSISFDYTLQMLYIPFVWIAHEGVQSSVLEATPRWLLPTMVCFALIFSPEIFLSIGGVLFYGQFKAVILLALFALCCTYRFDSSEHSIRP